MEYRCKVTVIDKKLYSELQAEYCEVPDSGKCPCYNVGDEFLFYHAITDREDISCLESDKLVGGWFTIPEMQEARQSGHMESWSAICFDELLDKEGDE